MDAVKVRRASCGYWKDRDQAFVCFHRVIRFPSLFFRSSFLSIAGTGPSSLSSPNWERQTPFSAFPHSIWKWKDSTALVISFKGFRSVCHLVRSCDDKKSDWWGIVYKGLTHTTYLPANPHGSYCMRAVERCSVQNSPFNRSHFFHAIVKCKFHVNPFRA